MKFRRLPGNNFFSLPTLEYVHDTEDPTPRAPSPYRTDLQVTTAERQQLWKTFFDMAEALEDDDETLEISADNPNQHMDELCLQHKARVEQMCEEHLQQMDHICVENKYPFTFSQLHQMYQDALSARQVAEAELQSLQTWMILDERAGAEQQANAREAALNGRTRALGYKMQPTQLLGPWKKRTSR